jgi:hypothetical protein
MANIAELGPPIGQVETDTFCEGCGYNLHTQMVVRDERLGILVSRCPECGRFAAAGRTTSASSVWLNRLGTLLLVLWVFFVLAIFSLCILFIGMAAYAHAIDLWRALEYYNVRLPNPDLRAQVALACVAGVLGLITGGLFSVLLWHVRGWRRVFGLVPPFLACGGAALVWAGDSPTRGLREWGIVEICLYLLLLVPALAIGAWTGRPIARGFLKLLVPPKARQHLAFLWIVDGKVPPHVRSTPRRAGNVARALPAGLPTGEHSQSGRTHNGA